MALMPLLSRLLTLLVILTMPLFLARLTLIPIKSRRGGGRVICISITTILRRGGSLWGPWLSLFFFSSRRRHTRSDRDWSSDVCSSDLSRRRHTRSDRDWSSDVCSSDLIGRAHV